MVNRILGIYNARVSDVRILTQNIIVLIHTFPDIFSHNRKYQAAFQDIHENTNRFNGVISLQAFENNSEYKL